MLNIGIPPSDKPKKRNIDSHMGLIIKKIARESKNIGARRMALILKQQLPNRDWYPQKDTIIRFLKEQGYSHKKHKLKPFLNEEHIKARLSFAQRWTSSTNESSLSKLGLVIWSDETNIRARPLTYRNSSWVPKNTLIPFQEKAIAGKFSVMFWGCISIKGRGPLVVIPKNTTIDANEYKKILRKYLLPEAEYLIKEGFELKVMHDGAPGHSANSVWNYIKESGIEFIDWPSNSPDLNPIENIWGWVKMKLYSEYPLAKSDDELIDYVIEIWEKIDIPLIERFCLNYEKRLEAVLKAKGGHTKY